MLKAGKSGKMDSYSKIERSTKESEKDLQLPTRTGFVLHGYLRAAIVLKSATAFDLHLGCEIIAACPGSGTEQVEVHCSCVVFFF